MATCCLDTGISALGKTCDSLGLTGLQEKAAIMCNDKSKMKKAFMEYGVSTAQYFEISSEEELKNALDKIKLPVIIKATDLQGSNGIYIAKTRKRMPMTDFMQQWTNKKILLYCRRVHRRMGVWCTGICL